VLGAKLISNEWSIWSAIFYIDNQASITATQLTKPAAGHHILDALHKHIAALKQKHRGIHIEFKWIPGHKGVEGNEQADELAKKLITEGSSNKHNLPKYLKKTLPHSVSALKWAYNEKLKCHAQKLWEKSPRYSKMKKTDPKTPSNKYITLITGLPRKLASILTQLQMGHAPLAKHLHHIGTSDSPICPACLQSDESVQHFMLHCPAHLGPQQMLQNNTGNRNIDLTKLLTSAAPKTQRALFKYIAKTGRFHNTFGELPTLKKTQQEARACSNGQ
jgi:hypothetical protein